MNLNPISLLLINKLGKPFSAVCSLIQTIGLRLVTTRLLSWDIVNVKDLAHQNIAEFITLVGQNSFWAPILRIISWIALRHALPIWKELQSRKHILWHNWSQSLCVHFLSMILECVKSMPIISNGYLTAIGWSTGTCVSILMCTRHSLLDFLKILMSILIPSNEQTRGPHTSQ